MPETPANVAATQDAASPPIPKGPAKPTAKRPAKKAPRKKAAADPGPPPPLPPDLMIPPKPPLPRVVEEVSEPVEEPLIEAPDALPADALGEEADAERVPDPEREPPGPAVPFTAVIVAEPDVVEAEPEVVEVEPEVVEVEPEIAEPEPAIEEAAPPAVDLEEPAAELPLAPAHWTETAKVPDALVAASLDAGTAALVVKGVSKGFGATRAVDGIDLTVPAGIFYGLVGPNGAGKTTTLSMIAGLLRPDRGTIRVNGVDAAANPLRAKRQMGVLPDRLRTFDRLTGRQLLHYYGVLRGLPSAVVESRTTDLARAFDLSDALGRVVSDYSAGMAKKVMIAGAMIHSPRLLVLDEPFEAVDPVSSLNILDILSTYVAHGGTVILSSHGMDLVERVCSRVAVMVAGQVLAEGTVDQVRGELTLEQRFIELAGGLTDVEGLEWLHTFSD